MTSAKVAVSIPKDVLERAKAEVATGRAKNLSVLVINVHRIRGDTFPT